MKIPATPFPMVGYYGPKYFCDRKREMEWLTKKVEGGIPSVIIGRRRLGKTALIHHLFHKLAKRKYVSVYVDILGTGNFNAFLNRIAEGIAKSFPENKFKQLWDSLKSLRPTVSFDEYTGLPQFTFDIAHRKDRELTFDGLLKALSDQKVNVVLAIDEFQQIIEYDDVQAEGTIRTLMQRYPEIHYLFSGSQTHLLNRMFQTGSRPFFGSVDKLFLEEIGKESLRNFVVKQFSNAGKSISLDLADIILEWTCRHTYYTQFLCNQLFLETSKGVRQSDLLDLQVRLLESRHQDYYQLKDILATNQWNLLVAIAREGSLYQPTSVRIIRKYSLATPAAIRKSIVTLLDKQLIYEGFDENGAKYYRVLDVFLMRWIRYKF